MTAAARKGTIVPGFNIFGYEDAQAVIRAAERACIPVLLMVNRDATRVMALEHWAALLTSLSRSAKVPVGVHLDHCSDLDSIRRAIDCGFDSVMYDGSKLPLEENIAHTWEIADHAHRRGVVVEAEVGTVPYSDRGEIQIQYTDPLEAKRMAEESGADWLAVSVGNIHRLTIQKTRIDFALLRQIQENCHLPLVIHGTSGVKSEDVIRLRDTQVGKVNVGTALRQAFGKALRESVCHSRALRDRLQLLESPNRETEEAAYRFMIQLQ